MINSIYLIDSIYSIDIIYILMYIYCILSRDIITLSHLDILLAVIFVTIQYILYYSKWTGFENVDNYKTFEKLYQWYEKKKSGDINWMW